MCFNRTMADDALDKVTSRGEDPTPEQAALDGFMGGLSIIGLIIMAIYVLFCIFNG